MSYIRECRNDFISSEELDHLYINHSLKFVEYIEKIGLGDRIIEINANHLKESVKYYCMRGAIKTVSTMNNHLNAIKRFYTFLLKKGRAENIFKSIADYDEFTSDIIACNNIKPSSKKGYLETDQINELLDYFNSKPQKYSNMTMTGIFFKINLLVPAKRGIIANLKFGDFSDNFNELKINGFTIKLPRALSDDIKTEITRRKVTTCSDGLFFEALCDCQYSENCFNTPFYYAMKELGFTPKKKKPSYPMEIIRNTGIVNLTINNVNPYLISRVAGISLSSLECLLRKFKNVIDDNNYGNERVNQEISKVSYYQSI